MTTKKTKDLSWNVIWYNINTNKFETINIFNFNWVFKNDLIDICKKHKKSAFSYEDFCEEVRRKLSYSYWAKCEYELGLVEWPCYISKENIKKAYEDSAKSDRRSIEVSGYISEYNKVDIYDQIMLNKDRFFEYLWNKADAIAKLKKFSLS